MLIANYEVNDYVFKKMALLSMFQHERDNLVETDGNEVSFSKNTTVYNLSVLLDQTGIEEPKTGDEYVFTLNAIVDKIENIE